MRLKFIRPYKSITGPVSEEELADFIVLSGRNGAGKSNLLEAILHGSMMVDDIAFSPGSPSSPVRFLDARQLASPGGNNSGASETVMHYYNSWSYPQKQVQQIITEFTRDNMPRMAPGSDILEAAVKERIIQMGLSAQRLEKMIAAIGKRLIDFTDTDFQQTSPLISGRIDPFSVSILALFLSYQARHERNELAQTRQDKGRTGGEAAISDEEFAARYGMPPWDVLNEIIESVGLDYSFNHPEGGQESVPFIVQLSHKGTGDRIDIASLSSGERVLMTITMNLYAGSFMSDAIEVPKVLLLDEPDASLHPAMTRDLLRVVDDIFHKRYGVKVILATHSPSTVALAPEGSLYTISRTGHHRLQRAVSRDDALAVLTLGLPTLSIRNDNRRQVIVESDDDERCYNEMFRLLRDKVSSPISLDFIASGKGGQGCVDAVTRLVQSFRESGNTVLGLIDRDDRKSAPDGIAFLPNRRSLENLALDPFLVGVFLIREHIIPAEKIAGESVTHFNLRQEHAQKICDYVTEIAMRPGDDQEITTVRYLTGFEVRIPSFYLNINGHDLEDRLRDSINDFRKYPKALKIKIIEYVLTDKPEYAPTDIIDLFSRLINSSHPRIALWEQIHPMLGPRP